MKVKDLIKALEKESPKMEVVLASDPEGNHFRPWTGIGNGWFDKNYDVYEDADRINGVKCKHAIILWP